MKKNLLNPANWGSNRKGKKADVVPPKLLLPGSQALSFNS